MSKMNYRIKTTSPFWGNLPAFLSLCLLSKSQLLWVDVHTDTSPKSVRKFQQEPGLTVYITSLKVLLNKTQIIEEMFSCSIFVSTVISFLNSPSLFLTFSAKIFLLCHVFWQGNCSCIAWGSSRMNVIKQTGKRVFHNTLLYRHTWVNMETKAKKAKLLSILLRPTLNYDWDVTGEKYMMKPMNRLRFRNSKRNVHIYFMWCFNMLR